MILAGGVLLAGCGGGDKLGTGGNPGTVGGGCGNASPDPCICGLPEASAEAAYACSKKTACEQTGGVWTPSSPLIWPGECLRDGGPLFLDGSAAGNDGGFDGGDRG